jgi:hypothetical protein
MKLIFICLLNFIPIQANITTIKFIIKRTTIIEESYSNISVNGEFERFREKIAKRESTNNPDIINSYGYIGLYQFGQAALKAAGYNVSVDSFRLNPRIFPRHSQNKAFKKLVDINTYILRDYIKKYNNKYVNGHKVTKSGLLAAAHLAGAGNVIRYFNEGYNAKDGFGTNLTHYLKEFEGYKF